MQQNRYSWIEIWRINNCTNFYASPNNEVKIIQVILKNDVGNARKYDVQLNVFFKIIIIITFIEISTDILLVLTLNRILSSMKIILTWIIISYRLKEKKRNSKNQCNFWKKHQFYDRDWEKISNIVKLLLLFYFKYIH